jgi:uncharacterized protein YpmB
MADKKLTEVTTASSSNSNDFVVLIQSNAVKKIELSKLNVGISEERITQIVEEKVNDKIPPSAEGKYY